MKGDRSPRTGVQSVTFVNTTDITGPRTSLGQPQTESTLPHSSGSGRGRHAAVASGQGAERWMTPWLDTLGFTEYESKAQR